MYRWEFYKVLVRFQEEVMIKRCWGLEKHTGDRDLKCRFPLKGYGFYTRDLNLRNEPTG